MISIRNLTKSFDDKIILNNISLDLPLGCTGVIGPNGSGKTTLLRLLSKDYLDYKGEIHLPFNRKSTYFVEDIDSLGLNLTGLEFLNLIVDVYGIEKRTSELRINAASEFFDIRNHLTKFVKKYSHGTLKKLMICGSLLCNPEFMIYDEPTNGLDYEYIIQFKNLINQLKLKNRTILISSHNINLIQDIMDEVVILSNGEKKFFGNLEDFYKTYKSKTISESWMKILHKETSSNEQLEKLLSTLEI